MVARSSCRPVPWYTEARAGTCKYQAPPRLVSIVHDEVSSGQEQTTKSPPADRPDDERAARLTAPPRSE